MNVLKHDFNIYKDIFITLNLFSYFISRTHPKIVEYLSKAIYYQYPLKSSMTPKYPHLHPMKFKDSGSSVESFNETYNSFKNEIEAELLFREVEDYIELLDIKSGYDRILVCTPFYAQVFTY